MFSSYSEDFPISNILLLQLDSKRRVCHKLAVEQLITFKNTPDVDGIQSLLN